MFMALDTKTQLMTVQGQLYRRRKEPMKLQMTFAIGMMTLSLTACSSAIEKGDFCDIGKPLRTTSSDLAAQIVALDKPLARGINRHNAIIEECPKKEMP